MQRKCSPPQLLETLMTMWLAAQLHLRLLWMTLKRHKTLVLGVLLTFLLLFIRWYFKREGAKEAEKAILDRIQKAEDEVRKKAEAIKVEVAEKRGRMKEISSIADTKERLAKLGALLKEVQGQ